MTSLGNITLTLRTNTTQFTKGLRTATAQTKGFGKNLKSISKTSKRTASSIKNMQNPIKQIGMGMKMWLGAMATQAVIQGFREMITTFSEFSRSITRTASVMGYTGAAMDGMRQRAEDVATELGGKTVFTANEASKAMYSLASAGFNLADSVSTVSEGFNTLQPFMDYAAATSGDLEFATQSVSEAIKMFGYELGDAREIVDIFTGTITNSFLTARKLADGLRYVGATAGILGISLEDTTAALATLAEQGLEGAQSGRRLNMILTKLLDPTKEAEDALNNLGLTLDDVNPQAHSLQEILVTLREAGFGASDAAKMFRAATAGTAAALVENSSAIGDYKDDMLMAAGVTQALAEAQEDSFWGSLKKVHSALEKAGITLVKSLQPALEFIANIIKNNIAPALEGIASFFKGAHEYGAIIKAVAGALGFLSIAIGGYVVASKIAKAATWAWNAALYANPIMVVVGAIALLVGALVGLASHFGVLDDAIEGATAAWENFIGWLEDIGAIHAASEAIKILGEVLKWTTPIGWAILAFEQYGKAVEAAKTEADRFNDILEEVDDTLSDFQTQIGSVDRSLNDYKESIYDLREAQRRPSLMIESI